MQSLLNPLKCQLQSNKFIIRDDETLGQQQLFGLELEYIYAPDTAKMRCVAYLMNKNMLSLEELRDQTLSSFGPNITPLQMSAMHKDGENDELVLYPISLRAYYALRKHLQYVFQQLHNQGYEPWGPLNEIGLHISVERSMISAQTMERILYWLLENNELFIFLSGRKSYSTVRADIRWLLGDKYYTWTEEEITWAAKDQISIFTHAFKNKYKAELFGIRTYTQEPYVQFTQFGSTLSADSLLTKIEFIDALIFYCDSSEDKKTENFIKHISQQKYPYLYDTLQSLNI